MRRTPVKRYKDCTCGWCQKVWRVFLSERGRFCSPECFKAAKRAWGVVRRAA